MTTLAVVVVSYNVRDLLADTLTSLERSLRDAPFRTRTVVVDNQSDDGSGAMVRARFPSVELLEPGSNLGFAGGNNFGLRHLGFGQGGTPEAEFVWLLNPDTVVVGDAPHLLLRHLQSSPGVGAVGPKLEYGDGGFQHGAFALPGMRQVLLDLFPLHPRLLESRLNGRYPRTLWEGGSPFPVDMLLGAALMVRGAAIEEVGLLDEGYFMYAEEVDWCRRMRRAAWRLEAVPGATVVHHGGQSTRQFRARMFVALWRSRLRYYEKWESPAHLHLVRLLLRMRIEWESWRLRVASEKGDGQQRLSALWEVLDS